MTNASQTSDMPRDGDVAKLAELIADTQVCMLTTVDPGGQLVSRPMAVQQVEFDGDLWFFSNGDARKVDQVRHDPGVNVAFSSRDSWVSVTGQAEVVQDVVKAKQLWSAGVSAWFPGGPEDPGLVLLKVHADGAEYWDTPGAGVVSLLSFVKSRFTGKAYDVEDKTVDL